MTRISNQARLSNATEAYQASEPRLVGSTRSRMRDRAGHGLHFLTERWLRHIHTLDLASLSWRPSGRRSYVSLVGNGPDIWLIRWPPGTEAPMHDHGGASGVIAIIRGELEEEVATLGGMLRRIEKGQVVSLHSKVVHAVRNTSTTDAYSLHVYAPALAVMSFYTRGQQGSWKVERTEYAGDWT